MLPRRSYSESNLLTVDKLIEAAFGASADYQTIDFKLVEAILLIIGRSLCVLDRKVAVELPHSQTIPQGSDISISEIKVSVTKHQSPTANQSRETSRASISKDSTVKINEDLLNKKATNWKPGDNVKKMGPSKTISNKSSRKSYDRNSQQSTGKKDNVESYTEKILVVDRRSSSKVKLPKSSSEGNKMDKTPQSLVTKVQFGMLADSVKQLQQRFRPNDGDLRSALYGDAYYSDPVAVLQISARLEHVEEAIESLNKKILDVWAVYNTNMITTTGDLLLNPDNYVFTSKNNLSITTDNISSSSEMPPDNNDLMVNEHTTLEYKNTSIVTDDVSLSPTLNAESKHLASPETLPTSNIGDMPSSIHVPLTIDMARATAMNIATNVPLSTSTPLLLNLMNNHKLLGDNLTTNTADSKDESSIVDRSPLNSAHVTLEINQKCLDSFESKFITFERLRCFIESSRHAIMKAARKAAFHVTKIIRSIIYDQIRIAESVGNILKKERHANFLDRKVFNCSKAFDKIDKIYTKKINCFSEQLMALSYEIRKQVDYMADVLGQKNPNIENVLDLTKNVTALTEDVGILNKSQHELNTNETWFFNRILELKKKLDDMKVGKAARDFVENALESKISSFTVNRIMTSKLFSNIYGSWEHSINSIAESTQNVELFWQHKIDAVLNNLDRNKTNETIMHALQKDFESKFNLLDEKINSMLQVYQTDTTRENKMVRHTEPCISCKLVDRHAMQARPNIERKSKLRLHREGDTIPICYQNAPVKPQFMERAMMMSKPCFRKLNDPAGRLESCISVRSLERNPEISQQETIACPQCVRVKKVTEPSITSRKSLLKKFANETYSNSTKDSQKSNRLSTVSADDRLQRCPKCIISIEDDAVSTNFMSSVHNYPEQQSILIMLSNGSENDDSF